MFILNRLFNIAILMPDTETGDRELQKSFHMMTIMSLELSMAMCAKSHYHASWQRRM
jgi:hypothetical protein